MAKNGFKIIDSDMHIMEPPDLWEGYTITRRPGRPYGVLDGMERLERYRRIDDGKKSDYA